MRKDVFFACGMQVLRMANKMKFKLYFVKVTHGKGITKRKTSMWTLRKDSNHACGELLGIVRWHGAWRQYVFIPENGTIWSSGCLKTIAEFLDKINKRHRKKLKFQKLQNHL